MGWRGDDVAASSAAGASVAAARDARGKRKQLTLASDKKLQAFSFFCGRIARTNKPTKRVGCRVKDSVDLFFLV